MLNCLHPIVINKEGRYRNIQRYSVGTMVVPCRNCENCRRNRSMDFTIRAYYDYKWFTSTKYNGFKGFGMFDTLTFDEVHVPRTTLYGDEFMCFSPDIVNSFKKKFEKNAIKRLLDVRKLPHNPKNRTLVRTEVRNLLCMTMVAEYGGMYHRPHYHILIFNKIPEFTASIIENLYMTAWTDDNGVMLGGVEDIPSSKKVIEGLGKIIYVSGYVNKDEDFYTTKMKSRISSLSTKEKNKFIPVSYYYRGFGKHVFDYYTERELLQGAKIQLPDGKNGYNYFALPKYLLDKLIRDVVKIQTDKEVVYSKPLNDAGIEYYGYTFAQRHQKLENDFAYLYENGNNYEYSDNSISDKVHTKYTWKSILDRKMDECNVNFFELATYQLLYRGRFGAVNPVTGKARTMRLDDYRRRFKEVYTTKYYSDVDDLQSVYDSGIFSNRGLDELLDLFSEFNYFLVLSKTKSEDNERVRDSKKRFRKIRKGHNKLKFVKNG